MSINNISTNTPNILVHKSSNPVIHPDKDLGLLESGNNKIEINDLLDTTLNELDTKPLSNFI